MTTLLPAASLFSASKFLATYGEEFLDVVYAKQSLLKLKRKGVISQAVITSIVGANDEDAKYFLFEHLEKNATIDTLREYCEVAIAADGFPRMQALGRKMMEALSYGGWLVHGVGWVGTYLHTTCVHAFVTLCIIHALLYIRLCFISMQVHSSCSFSAFIPCCTSEFDPYTSLLPLYSSCPPPCTSYESHT